MRFWWVNQNQTYHHEIRGGYLWSPKRKANNGLNPFYEFMREVTPGDVILSFKNSYIYAVGVARSHCYSFPKPTEFGTIGGNWGPTGWKVDVKFTELSHRIKPADHMQVLGRYLPAKYSPLSGIGRGRQSVYLAEVSELFFGALSRIIGPEAEVAIGISRRMARSPSADVRGSEDVASWEDKIEKRIREDSSVPETEKQSIILARRGQGAFRRNVAKIETRCRITLVSEQEHLVASHCKPWRDSSDHERLDGENGLLLTPTIDHLFDQGYISFENDGRLLVSPVASSVALRRMGIETDKKVMVGTFSEGQRHYLSYHRDSIFLESKVKRR